MEHPRVLLVEDNRVLRRWMLSGLEEAGFDVVSAASAEEAQWLGACFKFDVLVTDWHLSGDKDGFEVMQHLRAKHPKLLTVLVSAHADAELAQRAWKAGFNVVLQKPLRLAEVIGAIYCMIGEQGIRGVEVNHEVA
jgi:DNA-binding response OmpR family regulator